MWRESKRNRKNAKSAQQIMRKQKHAQTTRNYCGQNAKERERTQQLCEKNAETKQETAKKHKKSANNM